MKNYITSRDYEALWNLINNDYEVIGKLNDKACLIYKDNEGYHFHTGWRDYALVPTASHDNFISNCHGLEYIFPVK